jgi:hypothetical protein
VDTEEAGASDFHVSAFLPQDVSYQNSSLSAGDIFQRRQQPVVEDDFADSLQQALESSFGNSGGDAYGARGGAPRKNPHALSQQEHEEWEALDDLDHLGEAAAHQGVKRGEKGGQKNGKSPSFVRRAEKAARWQRPWVRVLLSLLALLLMAALAAQMAWRQRDYLAVAHPQLRPWLEQACTLAGCKLGAWHDIDVVKVESSAFNKAGEQQFRVSINLRNAAAWPVATPSVLLSLSNADGQIVLRRVFSPAELGLPSSTLALDQQYTGSALLDVADNELSNAIVDYQMMVFYP